MFNALLEFHKTFRRAISLCQGRQRLALSHTQLVTDDDHTVECYQPHTGRTAHTDTHTDTHTGAFTHTLTHTGIRTL